MDARIGGVGLDHCQFAPRLRLNDMRLQFLGWKREMKPFHHRHVQTVVGTVQDAIKLVEALVLRLTLRFGAEMPFAEHGGVVSCPFEHFR